MSNFNISGIQQVGIGCQNFYDSWQWYIDNFGANIRILEDDTVAERMLPYTGNQAQKRHACIAVNLQGGSGFEIWQYSDRKPCPLSFAVAPGDLGIFAAKIRSHNVAAFHKELSSKYNKKEVGALSKDPKGNLTFWICDPWGNYFQIVEDNYRYIRCHRNNGGVCGAVIGVTNMNRSKDFYMEVLGFDKVIYDTTSCFEDWDLMPESEGHFRRVLLGTNKSRKGAFSELFGDSTIELVQAIDRPVRKIYEGRYWGDPGFIQVCFDVTGMKAFKEFCASKGCPFTVDSCPGDETFDMGDASGHFTYIEDPDGTLIEFVETGKIPVLKKLGLYIDMTKRNQYKPLPKFLFRLMGLTKIKSIKK